MASAVSDYDDPRAHRVRDNYRALFGGEELPVPVESIAEDLLGLVVETHDDLAVSGMLLPAERRILVNAAEPVPRQRFTIAHELGHWICQCREGETKPVYCRAEEIGVDPEAKTLEREANIFAANLLLPEPAVKQAWAETWDMSRCAGRFDVSVNSMHWRLFNLGVVAESPS